MQGSEFEPRTSIHSPYKGEFLLTILLDRKTYLQIFDELTFKKIIHD